MIPTLRDTLAVGASGNAKTGPIPTTSRPFTTCPPDCPLAAGCYGRGYIGGTVRKHARTERVDATAARIGPEVRPEVRVMRDRVIGDLLDARGRIDIGHVLAIVSLARAIRRVRPGEPIVPGGYTHLWPRFTARMVRIVRASGYVLNASCETLQDVQDALARGLPATIASDTVAEGTRIGGKRIVTCPAQRDARVTCMTCRLCYRWDRPTVPRFLLHGPAARLAREAVAAREAGTRARVAARGKSGA